VGNKKADGRHRVRKKQVVWNVSEYPKEKKVNTLTGKRDEGGGTAEGKGRTKRRKLYGDQRPKVLRVNILPLIENQ